MLRYPVGEHFGVVNINFVSPFEFRLRENVQHGIDRVGRDARLAGLHVRADLGVAGEAAFIGSNCRLAHIFVVLSGSLPNSGRFYR